MIINSVYKFILFISEILTPADYRPDEEWAACRMLWVRCCCSTACDTRVVVVNMRRRRRWSRAGASLVQASARQTSPSIDRRATPRRAPCHRASAVLPAQPSENSARLWRHGEPSAPSRDVISVVSGSSVACWRTWDERAKRTDMR